LHCLPSLRMTSSNNHLWCFRSKTEPLPRWIEDVYDHCEYFHVIIEIILTRYLNFINATGDAMLLLTMRLHYLGNFTQPPNIEYVDSLEIPIVET
jgi:hypothetical protein